MPRPALLQSLPSFLQHFAKRQFARHCLGLCLLLIAGTTFAAGQVFQVATRPGVTTAVYWEARENAALTVVLFPGGGGGFGRMENGRPTSNNFLVRSVPHFLANDFNVAILGKPSDDEDLDFADRTSASHIGDIRAALDFIKSQSSAPLWMVGTSRGTISVAAAAIHLQEVGIGGAVLTASVVGNKKPVSLARQDLSAIKMPVLMLHHAKDACVHCPPHEVPAVLARLTNAPVKRQVIVDGGESPSGDPCAAMHWHGFIGMEKEAVDIIADWIRNPAK